LGVWRGGREEGKRVGDEGGGKRVKGKKIASHSITRQLTKPLGESAMKLERERPEQHRDAP
jgi:hypothetical protein